MYPSFPKIPRLHREVIITEMIDGTNGLIHIERHTFGTGVEVEPGVTVVMDDTSHDVDGFPEFEFHIRAGSKNRWITPDDDNYGFAAWVKEHAVDLAQLGPGHHYGEWWGKGIQRGYGLSERRFSLFNTSRWWDLWSRPACVDVVPIIAAVNGSNLNAFVGLSLGTLKQSGSYAALGYMNPEGIVVYHTAANTPFKVTLDKDEAKALRVPPVIEGELAEPLPTVVEHEPIGVAQFVTELVAA